MRVAVSGREIALTTQGADDGPLWVLFPGFGYHLDLPAFEICKAEARRRGEAIWGVETQYDRDGRLAGRSRDAQLALIQADASAVLQQLPPRPLVLVGKSVGCIALWQAVRDAITADFVWITPDLTHEPLAEAVAQVQGRSLIVAGGADPKTPRDACARLQNVVILPGATHPLLREDGSRDDALLAPMAAALAGYARG